jgi:hypothetical protein
VASTSTRCVIAETVRPTYSRINVPAYLGELDKRATVSAEIVTRQYSPRAVINPALATAASAITSVGARRGGGHNGVADQATWQVPSE